MSDPTTYKNEINIPGSAKKELKYRINEASAKISTTRIAIT